MKKKKITVNINSTYKFLQVWNGIFDLTNKELEILAAFIDTGLATKNKNLCSITNKKLVAKTIGIKDHNTLNNYIKKFKDKGVFKKEGSNYTSNSLLDTDTNIIEIEFRRL
tara:strand:+ start:1282 stop:1614 length:333 start_codon:yes stop_codon:yes gene_type:complete